MRHLRDWSICIIVLCALLQLGCNAKKANFSGKWNISNKNLHGEMVISQEGSIVNGEYLYMTILNTPAGGKIEGRVVNDSLLKFTEYHDNGDVHEGFAVMAHDGLSFEMWIKVVLDQYMLTWKATKKNL
jgi:hypothetical protein